MSIEEDDYGVLAVDHNGDPVMLPCCTEPKCPEGGPELTMIISGLEEGDTFCGFFENGTYTLCRISQRDLCPFFNYMTVTSNFTSYGYNVTLYHRTIQRYRGEWPGYGSASSGYVRFRYPTILNPATNSNNVFAMLGTLYSYKFNYFKSIWKTNSIFSYTQKFYDWYKRFVGHGNFYPDSYGGSINRGVFSGSSISDGVFAGGSTRGRGYRPTGTLTVNCKFNNTPSPENTCANVQYNMIDEMFRTQIFRHVNGYNFTVTWERGSGWGEVDIEEE